MIITLYLHIFSAILSITTALKLFIRPTSKTVRIQKYLITSTFVSGTALVLLNSRNLVSTCVSGILFLGFTLTSIKLAKLKLKSI